MNHATAVRLLDAFPAHTRRKATALLGEAKVTLDPEHVDVWHVQGSGPTPYRVQVGGDYLTCTCPNGLALGDHPACYHAAAVLVRLVEVLPRADETTRTSFCGHLRATGSISWVCILHSALGDEHEAPHFFVTLERAAELGYDLDSLIERTHP